MQEARKDTPKKILTELTKGQRFSPEVKKKLLFGEVIVKQLKENFKNKSKSRHVVSSIAGKIVKNNKYLSQVGNILSHKMLQGGGIRRSVNKMKVNRGLKVASKYVAAFLEKDENSRVCPGKKDTITLKKSKKQKRLLNDSLFNLHKTFILENTHVKLSYASFCKLRPFWIVSPKVTDRNTCLCSVHENMALITRKLYQNKVIKECSPHELCKALCCESEHIKEECLMRICNSCKDKTVTISETFEDDELITYERWVTKKINVIIKGKEKICQRTLKQEVTSTKVEAFANLKQYLYTFLTHVCNMKHQQPTVAAIKENLTFEDVLIHIDFSENYVCKYGKEILAVHFGGSKPQITLHTVVVYYKCPQSSVMKSTCYCTVSRNLRHDPSAICVHLDPICRKVKLMIPNLKNVHFLSDGPATQYRNRKMFYFIGRYLAKSLDIETISWHYSESGHGKGVPDGVGGCLKRIADAIVARGEDIPNYERFTEELQKSCHGIEVIPVEDDNIVVFDKLLPEKIPTFKGTLRIHHISSTKANCDVLQARHLSCLDCYACLLYTSRCV